MIKEYINKIIDKNFEYIKKDIYLFNYLKKIQFFNLFFDIIIVLLKEDKIKKSDLKKIKKLQFSEKEMENANNDTLQEKMKDDIKNLIINKIYKDKKYIEEMTFNLVSKFNENVKNVFNSN